MKDHLLILRLFFLIVIAFTFNLSAQTPCQPPQIVFNKNAENIFTEQQEMYLGEVMAEQLQKNYRVIRDENVNRIVREIGQNVVKHLPPTDLKFEFHVVDLPRINAFATAGGKIYVTRKLIAFVRSEDELAGIIAHELGHGIVRHGAIDMSRYFKTILKVTQLGDRKDVFDKYNELVDKFRTKPVYRDNGHENDQQLEADRIGVFAMTAAGYDPKAFTSAFDRLVEAKGKTGNWFSDLTGSTPPSQQRLREIIAAVKSLPKECLDNKASRPANDFQTWQTEVINYSVHTGKESVGNVFRRNSLKPGLRDQLKHLKFSRDGRYLIAQDYSTIFVLETEPLKLLFTVDAPGARNAKFSPDSKSIVFNTRGMRVEKWSVATQKPEMIREIFLRESCAQTALSDDGNTFACFSLVAGFSVNLKLLNVQTNETILLKEKFYQPDPIQLIYFSRASVGGNSDGELKIFQTEFSPDGRYFVAARIFKYASQTVQSWLGAQQRVVINAGNSGILGFDFQKNEEIKIDGDLFKIISAPFTFFSNDKIIGQNDKDRTKSGIFEFPSGKQLEKFMLQGDSIETVHKGNYVLVRPLKNTPVGVYDFSQQKILAANKTPAFDAFDNMIASENKDGVLGLYRLDRNEVISEINLPESRLGSLRTVAISPDLNWVAISDDSRGAVWSTYSGEIYFYVQGFRGAYFDKESRVFADFARTENNERQIAAMDVKTRQITAVRPVGLPNTRQYGRFLFTSVGSDPPKKKNDEKDVKPDLKIENPDDYQVSKNGTIEVRDVSTGEMLWTKKFPNEMPRRYFSSANETIAFLWRLTSAAAKDIVKNDEKLRTAASAMGNKDGDYLVQIFSAEKGDLIGQTLIETGEGSFEINSASSSGDWLAVTDSENRVLCFSLSTGELKHRFFGENTAISTESNIAVVENFPGQLAIYDLTSGEKINELQFKTRIVLAQFDKYGKKLLVLTADQESLIFDAAKFPRTLSAKSN